MQRIFIHGLLTGILSAVACLVYNNLYTSFMCIDFSSIINIWSVMATCLTGSLIAAAGYFGLSKLIKHDNTVELIFNVTFIFLTFISCIYPLNFPLNDHLPEDFSGPELFYGLVVAMHFFPVLFWIALNPVFRKLGR